MHHLHPLFHIARLTFPTTYLQLFRLKAGDLCCLGVSPFSPHFLEVFSPFPGGGDLIDPLHYPQITVVCNRSPLVFSPCKPKAPDGDEEDDGDASAGDHGKVKLLGVQKGDVGAAAAAGSVHVGDVLLVRGHFYTVTGVAAGGMPYEVYNGADLLVFNRAFDFNSRRAVAHRCEPVCVRAKHGFLPSALLENFEPVRCRFRLSGAAKRLGIATAFSTSFWSLLIQAYAIWFDKCASHLPVFNGCP